MPSNIFRRSPPWPRASPGRRYSSAKSGNLAGGCYCAPMVVRTRTADDHCVSDGRGTVHELAPLGARIARRTDVRDPGTAGARRRALHDLRHVSRHVAPGRGQPAQGPRALRPRSGAGEALSRPARKEIHLGGRLRAGEDEHGASRPNASASPSGWRAP